MIVKRLILLIFIMLLIGCGGNYSHKQTSTIGVDISTENRLTYGSIKKHLKVNKTTQADVLAKFGSPNNMTITSQGTELWIYDKIRTEFSGSANSGRIGGYIGIGIAGAGGNTSSSYSASTQSTKTLTVILEFNKNNLLIDYSARTGRY